MIIDALLDQKNTKPLVDELAKIFIWDDTRYRLATPESDHDHVMCWLVDRKTGNQVPETVTVSCRKSDGKWLPLAPQTWTTNTAYASYLCEFKIGKQDGIEFMEIKKTEPTKMHSSRKKYGAFGTRVGTAQGTAVKGKPIKILPG